MVRLAKPSINNNIIFSLIFWASYFIEEQKYFSILAEVTYTAEVNAHVNGLNKSKKLEFIVQAINDLNEEKETLEKVSL